MLTWRQVHAGDGAGIAEARDLFVEYQKELGIDLCFQGFEEELASLPGKYAAPTGALTLADMDGKVAACGAVRDLGGGVCELKRIYVRPEFRGLGIGLEMSEWLIDYAASAGYEICRLDTLRRLEKAVRMYEKLGFKEIPPYNFNPEPDIVYLERGIGETD